MVTSPVVTIWLIAASPLAVNVIVPEPASTSAPSTIVSAPPVAPLSSKSAVIDRLPPPLTTRDSAPSVTPLRALNATAPPLASIVPTRLSVPETVIGAILDVDVPFELGNTLVPSAV